MRYYFGFLISVGLIILIIFLLFHGGKSGVPTTSQPLISYANTGSQVSFTIDGPINANQDHQQVKIYVNKDLVTYDQIQGYDGNVVNQQQFINSPNAYSAFLYALQLAGFTLGNNSSSLSSEQGHCALGDRYIFELAQGGADLERFWATSCLKVKTYNGILPLTMQLFEAQVPNYQKLVRNIKL